MAVVAAGNTAAWTTAPWGMIVRSGLLQWDRQESRRPRASASAPLPQSLG